MKTHNTAKDTRVIDVPRDQLAAIVRQAIKGDTNMTVKANVKRAGA